MKTLRIFVAEGCPPCAEIKQSLVEGKVNVEGVGEEEEIDIQVHDITTEAGYEAMKGFDLNQVPRAFIEKTSCEILIDPENKSLTISCPVAPGAETSAQIEKPE